jgi:hypothetical protein
MADVAEILRFKEYASDVGTDKFHSQEIERQLQDAIHRGHDVQLHIHPSYFGAHWNTDRWAQNLAEYDFATLPRQRMDSMIGFCKEYLESLLKPVNSNYRCDVFRAANWSVCPSSNVVKALLDNGIRIDTSVFKYGRRTGRVRFDYSSAVSALVPWRVNANDICTHDESGQLWEFPIYAELRRISAFATPQRVHRAIVSRYHRLSDAPSDMARAPELRGAFPSATWRDLFGAYAWKADFNQCSGRQLMATIKRANVLFATKTRSLPFVLIGHSKLFSRLNEWSLRPFLAYIRKYPHMYKFGTFGDFPTPRAFEDSA